MGTVYGWLWDRRAPQLWGNGRAVRVLRPKCPTCPNKWWLRRRRGGSVPPPTTSPTRDLYVLSALACYSKYQPTINHHTDPITRLPQLLWGPTRVRLPHLRATRSLRRPHRGG